jgi:23S rRNA G2445 N2-methylase RlmL
MDKMEIYKLSFLKGTGEYITKELLEKFPSAQILKETKENLLFSNISTDIKDYRILYSPTHIEDEKGRVLNLSRRDWRKGYVPAGIDPSLAYIMCMIADLQEKDIVYDPFCGSSVIPITALKYFNVKRAICSDISGTAINISEKNFKAAKIPRSRYVLFRSDISDVKLNKKNLDRIITNLPFGIRVGQHEENIQVYSELEILANRLLRLRGKLILLTQEKKLLREVFKKRWDVKSELRVDQGGLLPEVFVVSRKDV